MKKLIAGILLAVFAVAASAQTFTVQNLHVLGTNTFATPLTIANGGTGAGSASAALTSLGAAASANPAFTGTQAFFGAANSVPFTLELGSTSNAAGYGTVDFHSSGNANDYDSRLIPSGGTTVGTGTLTVQGGAFVVSPPATFSSTIIPSQTSGIVGTTTNNNANAGSFGEYPSPTNLSGVSLTSLTPANVASISLGAGDWDVQCSAQFIPAASTSWTSLVSGVSTTTATLGTLGTYQQLSSNGTTGGFGQIVLTSPVVRESLASTTTVFCVVNAQFTVSTMTASGFLRARRVR
jgi:hypothetical protein